MSKIDDNTPKDQPSFEKGKGEEVAASIGWKKRDYIFMAAAGVIFSFCGPYMYYTIVVYQHI